MLQTLSGLASHELSLLVFWYDVKVWDQNQGDVSVTVRTGFSICQEDLLGQNHHQCPLFPRPREDLLPFSPIPLTTADWQWHSVEENSYVCMCVSSVGGTVTLISRWREMTFSGLASLFEAFNDRKSSGCSDWQQWNLKRKPEAEADKDRGKDPQRQKDKGSDGMIDLRIVLST